MEGDGELPHWKEQRPEGGADYVPELSQLIGASVAVAPEELPHRTQRGPIAAAIASPSSLGSRSTTGTAALLALCGLAGALGLACVRLEETRRQVAALGDEVVSFRLQLGPEGAHRVASRVTENMVRELDKRTVETFHYVAKEVKNNRQRIDFIQGLAMALSGGVLDHYIQMDGDCATNQTDEYIGIGTAQCAAFCEASPDCAGFSFRADEKQCLARSASCAKPVKGKSVFYRRVLTLRGGPQPVPIVMPPPERLRRLQRLDRAADLSLQMSVTTGVS